MKKKTVKVSKSLSLDKETIAKLNEEQLGDVEGGSVNSATCNTKASESVEEEAALVSCGACSCNGKTAS